MNEVVQAINGLTNVVNQSNNFCNINLVSLIEIFFSFALFWSGIFQYKQSKNLQEKIADRDLNNSMRNNILDIYTTFVEAGQKLINVNSYDKFKLGNSEFKLDLYNRLKEMNEYGYKLSMATNQMNLLFTDEEMKARLLELNNLYIEYSTLYVSYSVSEKNINNALQAWQKVNSAYPEIKINDSNALLLNDKAREFFYILCETDETKKLDEIFNKYMKLMEYDNFDKYFEKYLRMESIK